VRFHEPPPLGSNAFIQPAPAAGEGRTLSARALVLMCMLGAASGTAVGLVLLATVIDPKPSTPPVALAKSAARMAAAKDDAVGSVAAAPSADSDAVDGPSEAKEADSEPAARESRRARKGAAPTRRAKPAPAKLADQPTRAEVITAMSRVQPAVKECLAGKHAVVTADMKIIGKTGRVTTARITGQAGPAGSCIARAVRQAKFPQFKAESVSIRYPMAL
jgi:hypothetical protein